MHLAAANHRDVARRIDGVDLPQRGVMGSSPGQRLVLDGRTAWLWLSTGKAPANKQEGTDTYRCNSSADMLKPIFSARSATGGEEYINDERILFEMTQDGLKADPKRGRSKLEAISPGMKEFASLLHAGFDRRS